MKIALLPMTAALDGIALDANGPRNMLVIEAGENEGVFLAEVDMDKLRDYREREAWGNAFRKPRACGILTSSEVEKPFIRACARR